MVDLGRLIRLKSVEVFVRNGTCSSGTIECSDRLSGLYLLTSKVDTNTAPSTDSSSVWETCYQNNSAQGDSFKKKCSSNHTPLTRLFSILSTSGDRVELREVDIFGHEAAQLTEKVAGRKESSTYTSVTISFVPWNQLMVGFDPPTKYEVKAKHDGNIITSPGDITHDSNSERTTTTLSGLDPGIEYEISVSCLLEGSIPCEGISPTFMVSTSACSGPSPPEFHYAVNSIMDSGRERWNYTYNWEVSASNCRGLATYTYSSKEVQVQSITDRSATFLIDGYKEFTFTVTSENEAGLSSSSDSKEISPKLKPQFGVSNNIRLSPTSECVDLAWDKPEFIGGPESRIEYQVTCGEEENWVTANGLSASSCGHKPSTNVTCKLKALNGNLQSDELTATTTTLVEDVTTPSPASQTIIIAASIASVVVLLLVVGVVILVMFRRRKSLANNKSSNAAVFTANGPVSIEQEAPPVKKPSIKPRAHNPSAADEVETVANESPYGNADIIQASQSEAIPIGKLAWYNKTNISVIRQQYEALEKLPKPNMSVALQAENKGKCRYKGLYPSNKHRVRLDPTYPGETDFINATYLQAYSVDDHFIAAQGPFTDAVVKDFWLMIWQQKPSAIVMVTKAVENSKVKCLQYYPLDVGVVKTFGEFRVTLRSSEIWSDFTTNSLMVQKGDESRVIPHFNYIAWPDHGVPDLEVFVSFHRLVKSHIYRNFTQPVLIHCSAGVGRTGTYVALDYLLDQAKMEGVVDMFECVREMRTRRPCMIQTVEQYEFLHHVLYQSLSTKKFSCNAGQLAQKIDIHMTQPGSETDVIHAEYQHILERIQDLSLTYKTARASTNRKKNRYSEMLASDEHMPYLINGAHGNYVNATFVDGYREKKQWIATQLPLSHTVGDFWQLQTERQIHIVVQLEMTQTPFYPGIDGTDMVAGSILIKRNSSTDSEHVMTLSLEVESKEAKEAVYVIVLKNWEANSLPPSRKIIALHLAVEKLQQQTCSRKVTVTCLDASTRCGLYICAHNAIEKLKVEQDVDIYYPTVMAKLRRPQFVSLPEHYSHIYSIVQDYINEFSEYSNFK
ncbi:receptor-type tyrosine-protein phosphatase epsilon-like [Watersipora subatra]|uniref:receptor-type tyrosine-protein phosphatase epsilon-like n=1 Tax=Watersipora subatra TaxID=2589382 RepID=UPI00355B081F